MLLPGIVLPAQPAYAALLAALGDDVHAVAKDLEVYAEEEPPRGYGLELEVDGILREAGVAGFDRFHLGGYSGGGAAALMFAARYGDRLLSLALLEPAWAGNERSRPEEALQERFRALEGLPPDEQMAEFARLQLASGVEPRRARTARLRRGSRNARPVSAPFSARSTQAPSTSTRYDASRRRSTSPSGV